MHSVKFDGGKLKELRTARRWDQHKLAEQARRHAVGINQSSVSRYENGMEPTGRNAVALARALKVDVAELYGDSDDEDEESDLSGALERLLRRIVRDEMAARP